MISDSQDESYFQRMASSLGDKKRIVDYLYPGNVIDVGAGGGELSNFMNEIGYKVIAVDGSQNAVSKMNKNYPKLHVVNSLAENFAKNMMMSGQTFDNIVCSSILHEIFSYGGVDDESRFTNFYNCLTNFYSIMNSGGRLIIRDGVMPQMWTKKVRINLFNEDGKKFFESFMNHSPFVKNGSCEMRSIHLQEVVYPSNNSNVITVKGSFSSAMEFLYTYTWGWGSFEREVQEIYGLMPRKNYNEILQKIGFNIVESYEYVQSGYIEHLSPVSEILDESGVKLNFPSTNMIIVAEKYSIK